MLRLIAEGLNNREIAEKLVISEKTVKTHVSSILGKLHLADRTQAAIYALRHGLATDDGLMRTAGVFLIHAGVILRGLVRLPRMEHPGLVIALLALNGRC